MGSMELNSSGSSLDKKLNKSCLHLPLLRGSGKVCFPSACLVIFVWWWVFWVFLFICLFLKGNMYVANCWGVCFEALWNHTNCVPGCGVTLLLGSCSSRKISSVVRALRRGFVLLFWNAEIPVAGPSALMKGLLLGTAGESWSGPWQDSSEESLDLVLSLWWAGSCIGDYTVLLSVPGGTLMPLG